MFGLRNQRGSCWINATLQSIFRIPDVQQRFSDDEADDTNPIEMAMQEIWKTRGEEGLHDLYECVKTATMPAGEGIGDSHELLEFLCDKIPFLDKLVRFKVANVIQCKHCAYSDTRHDTHVEFSIASTQPGRAVSQSIVDAVKPFEIDDWKCEKCKHNGCTKQFLIATFPRVLVFHQTSVTPQTSVSYSAVLVVNQIKYALFAVVCFNGGHWWTYGRDLPPGKPWHELNDKHVQSFDPTHFPLDTCMRLLMYYRLNE
jgi:ubiquitin C-terminal hydrolase